jgi:DNA-binding PadR family transcriptional regulator
MTGSTYAAHCSFFDELKDEWIAAMSGRRTHGGHHPFGAQWSPFGGGPMFGPPWAQAGGPRGGWRAQKARRGDVRAALLAVLAVQPMNGYQIIQEISERSDGAWKPSPGSVYPTLQQLQDEGLVTADAETGQRAYTLTDEGRTYVAEHADEMAAVWEAVTPPADEDENGMKPLLGQIGTALWQILAAGTSDQQAKARKALVDLRRTLYGILADDDEDQDRS